MRPLIIFDLDGTLVDSKRDLCRSVNHVRSAFGMSELAEEDIAGMIGDGAAALIGRALGEDASEDQRREGLDLFLEYYGAHMLDETRLYAGVREVLDALSDCSLAVLTNKPHRFSCRMLEGLGIYSHFSVVYGGNSFIRKKPDPVGVFRILADTGAARETAWMVGDSSTDVLTGRRAGIQTCGVTYGYAWRTFKDHPPDVYIRAMEELPPLIRRA